MVFAEEETLDSTLQREKPKYEHSYDDLPDVCFFPKDKARWDGSEVTNFDWENLTDYQKTSFVYEGIKEIEREENVKINIKDGKGLLEEINIGVYNMNRKPPLSEFPMIKFLFSFVKYKKLVNFNLTGQTARWGIDTKDSVDVEATGYDWLNYTDRQKQTLIYMIFDMLEVDMEVYGVEDGVKALNKFYYSLYKECVKAPEHVNLDEFFLIPCGGVIVEELHYETNRRK